MSFPEWISEIMNDNLQIRAIRSLQETPYQLLALADPSSMHVEKYLEQGDCYIGILANEIVGVLVTLEINERTIEIKNIAVKDKWQGRGYGRMLLEYAEKRAISGGFRIVRIGTGNSSLHQLALYQKMGFEMIRIIRDYFLINYNEPIIENGIECKHMIVLEKKIVTK